MTWYLIVFISWKGFTVTPMPSHSACKQVSAELHRLWKGADGIVVQTRCMRVKP